MSNQVKKILFLTAAIFAFVSLEVFGGVTGKGIQAMIGVFAVGWVLSDFANYFFKDQKVLDKNIFWQYNMFCYVKLNN